MLTYLIILLDDTSVSFCHADNPRCERRLIPLDVLRQGIRYAMMENLTIQFVYPDYPLPADYASVIESIDHAKIKPTVEAAEVWVTDKPFEGEVDVPVVLRITRQNLFAQAARITNLIGHAPRLNIVITDIEAFTDDDFERYRALLADISARVQRLTKEGQMPWVNLVTDRMALTKMNNCGAGDSSITLAPNGRFYVCPAFYYEAPEDSIGDLEAGIDIRNRQLYKLEYAPLCRRCDAYQCRRCIWLNRKLTREVNTPSHEQCVVAHLERNASRTLLANIRKANPNFLAETKIEEIDYLDPFEMKREK